MAATMERLDEYRTHNAQFCKRVFDYLSIVCAAQVNYFCIVMNHMLMFCPGEDDIGWR